MNYYFALLENIRTTVSQSVGVSTSDVDEERVAKKDDVKIFISPTYTRHKLLTSRRKIRIDLNARPHAAEPWKHVYSRSVQRFRETKLPVTRS